MIKVVLKRIHTFRGDTFTVSRESDGAWLQEKSTQDDQKWAAGGTYLTRYNTLAMTAYHAREEIAREFPDFEIARVDPAD